MIIFFIAIFVHLFGLSVKWVSDWSDAVLQEKPSGKA